MTASAVCRRRCATCWRSSRSSSCAARPTSKSVDAGPKGAVIKFRGDAFANPGKLVEWIGGQGTRAKLRPDMKLVIMRDWDKPEERLKGTRQLMQNLVKLAA